MLYQNVVWQVSPNNRLPGIKEEDGKGKTERDKRQEDMQGETGRQRQKDRDREK